MHSQQAPLPLIRAARPAARRLGVALLLLGWLLGVALALEHRVAHGSGAAHGEPHALGGSHQDDEPVCRLADHAGLGDTLPSLPWAPAAPALAAAEQAAAPTCPDPSAAWRCYEARAPPRG
jgi:hypothetical protein